MGLPIQMDKISMMGGGMRRELRELMKELTFHHELPTIDLSQVIDSVT